MLINLRDVDNIGHAYYGQTFEDYTDAILIADTLAYQCWQTLQNHPHYHDKTTLIITTDHGRDLDDYRDHGAPDHWNRHCMFLALGPDIRKGHVVDARADLMDIAPTVAALLGFDMPYAEGRVLHEMLTSLEPQKPNRSSDPSPTDEINLSQSPGASLMPSLTVNLGGIHAVWSEKHEGFHEEKWSIRYARGSHFGSGWSGPITLTDRFAYHSTEGAGGATDLPGSCCDLHGAEGVRDIAFDPPDGAADGGVPRYASIIGGNNGELAVAVNGYADLTSLPERHILWGVNILTQNPDLSWSEKGFRNIGKTVATSPNMALENRELWTTWTDTYGTISLGKTDPGRQNPDHPLSRTIELTGWDADDSPWPFKKKFYRAPVVRMQSPYLHLIFELNKWGSGKIFYIRFNDRSYDEVNYIQMDSGDGPSFGPRIAPDHAGGLYVVWADYEQNRWQVKLRKSTDNGTSFGTARTLSHQFTSAWYPDIAVQGDRVVVVWEDYRDADGEIYMITSADGGGTWSPEIRVTDAPSFSAQPKIASYAGNFYIVWQDYRNGQWDIYFKELELP
jgi:hypothetical protein